MPIIRKLAKKDTSHGSRYEITMEGPHSKSTVVADSREEAVRRFDEYVKNLEAGQWFGPFTLTLVDTWEREVWDA